MTDYIERRISLDPLTEVRVRAMEDAGGAPVVDCRIWRKSPADTSADAWCPTAQGFAVPLATFPVVLSLAWKVQRVAALQARWVRASEPATLDKAS